MEWSTQVVSTLWDFAYTTAATDTFIQPLTKNFKTFIVTLGVLINLFGVVGNIVILVVMVRSKSLRKPYNGLVASMAVIDLALCGVVNMIQVAGIHTGTFPLSWPSEDSMCRAHNIMWIQLVFVSMLHISVIAAHRYLLVYYPHVSARITNKLTVTLLIFILHVVAFLVFCFGKLTGEMRFIPPAGCCIAWSKSSKNLLLIAGNLGITTTILLCSYIAIHLKVASVRKQLKAVCVNAQGVEYANSKNNLKRNTHHMKILQCMLVIFLLLVGGYLPVLASMGQVINTDDASPIFVSSTMLIVWVTNAVNSVVYGVLDSNFRMAYRKLMSCGIKIWPLPQGGGTSTIVTVY